MGIPFLQLLHLLMALFPLSSLECAILGLTPPFITLDGCKVGIYRDFEVSWATPSPLVPLHSLRDSWQGDEQSPIFCRCFSSFCCLKLNVSEAPSSSVSLQQSQRDTQVVYGLYAAGYISSADVERMSRSDASYHVIAFERVPPISGAKRHPEAATKLF
jgi:hypothetical protein